MAAGDIYSRGPTVIMQDEYFDIRPDYGIEIVVHNIAHDVDCHLEFHDGAESVIVSGHTGGGAWLGQFFHCDNDRYYRVKNNSLTVAKVYFDGVVTKSS